MKKEFVDLYDFLDDLEEPTEPEDIAMCCLSDAIDDISAELAQYRIDHDMTQEELAKQLKISQVMVSKYESGEENMSIGKLCSLMSKIGKKVKIAFEDAKAGTGAMPEPQFDNEMLDAMALESA